MELAVPTKRTLDGVTELRIIQLKTMGHNCVPYFTKAQLGCGFVVCSLAHGDAIGSELSDMINAPQAFECHVADRLWLRMATC